MAVVLCPKCQGQKHVLTPPWVAGDAPIYSAPDTRLYICPVCAGAGVLDTEAVAGTAERERLVKENAELRAMLTERLAEIARMRATSPTAPDSDEDSEYAYRAPSRAALFQNGMWAVVDALGRQIPALQGPDSYDQRDRIRREYQGPVETQAEGMVDYPYWVRYLPIQGRRLVDDDAPQVKDAQPGS